jgi:peptidoglycan hydrolase-like protein with peptidoglycan-binding domain
MVDIKVLKAQQWVNATYRGVAGYVRCPENGRTGLSTMHSLIMGLQHELGISPVAPRFEPSTMEKFQALGEIGFKSEHNPKIVEILEHGLFCKGYCGVEPSSYGCYTEVTIEAVKKLRSNMGIPQGDGTINVQIAKCILNMDAYVVVAGGTDRIREIQRWLNGRYWQRSAYSICPADGIYSRSVQKALIIAMQYELGLEPTGNFDADTRAELQSHSFAKGSTGIFVQLFSAACVFNEPIGTYRTNQRDIFDDGLTEYVRAFQRFSQLPENGTCDYQTWSQLLVSTGDPDRPAAGSDTRFEITASRAEWLVNNGYRIVGRYLYNPPGSKLDKDIKPGELQNMFVAGLRVFPIYQDNARRLCDFSYSTGYQHALNAHTRAVGYGFNKGTVIYFAVDYDATQNEIGSAIVPYFQGVVAGLTNRGKRYLHGVYGSRNVCKNVTEQTFARYSFVSGMSSGFSGNLGFTLPSNWSFNQIKEFKVTNGGNSFYLDRDVWRTDSDPGTASVNDPVSPADAFIAYIQTLYDIALAYKSDRSASQLVMEYVRHAAHGGKGMLDFVGGYDEGFVRHVEEKGIGIMKTFKDPFTGYDLGTEHMMATANGHFLIPQENNSQLVNGGDVAGWAGDLMTFYADWRNSEEQYTSGQAFCKAKLANPGVESSFGFDDLIEDADGYLIARAVRNGKSIVEAVRDHYNGNGGLHRFNNYFAQRWETAENAKSAAHNTLTTSGSTLEPARKKLITMAGAKLPSMLINLPGESEKLDGFEQGFVDALLARRDMEKSKLLTKKDSILEATSIKDSSSITVAESGGNSNKQNSTANPQLASSPLSFFSNQDSNADTKNKDKLQEAGWEQSSAIQYSESDIKNVIKIQTLWRGMLTRQTYCNLKFIATYFDTLINFMKDKMGVPITENSTSKAADLINKFRDQSQLFSTYNEAKLLAQECQDNSNILANMSI